MKEMAKIKPANVLVVGDFILDKYVNGEALGLSPEATIPIITVKSVEYRLGGAGNVAHNIRTLGGNVRILTALGSDEEGKTMMFMLKKISCDVRYALINDDIVTVCKTRVISGNQQMLRIDREEKKRIDDSLAAEIEHHLADIFEKIDIVVLSDYAKGFVSEENAQMIIRQAKKLDIPVLVDPKGKEFSKYRGAFICTPNMKELSEAVGLNMQTEEEILRECNKIIDQGIERMLVTRSEKGLSLVADGKKTDFPVHAKKVIDITGAGDTVVAMLAMGIASGISLGQCCVLANMAASIVISKFGTATVTMKEIHDAYFRKVYDKVIAINELEEIKKIRRKYGKKVVFTNGCFDLLHSGHLEVLQRASELGDILVVGVNSDASVKRLKGESRPIIDEMNRAIMLAGLGCVDFVVIFDEDTPQKIINALEPDILVKGADWKDKYISGSDVIQKKHGIIEFVDIKKGWSTTAIIEKIQKAAIL